MFSKILIANRGEIAVRIIRACKEMGIVTVAVFSEADRDSLHVSLADESYCIGNAAAKDSYLNMNAVVSTAIACGAEAIHPGYGFLSENPLFAKLCEDNHIVFIGPKSETIIKMGDKDMAKKTMKKAGVPVIPGCDVVESLEKAKEEAIRIGFPLLIKARSGGGGRGIRLVNSIDEFENQYRTAAAEAKSCFNDGAVYMEKFLKPVKHIEVQILGDHFGNVISLGERDCSVQRKNQKVIEESPCPVISEQMRKDLTAVSVKAGMAVGYTGAGTIEFLLDSDGNYYFMEMNTRLQVEHPVTEMVTGIDIVKWQIRIAANLPLGFTQEEVEMTGSSIECRINAEKPKDNFKPSCGKITLLHIPGGAFVRFDTAVFQDYVIPPYYDSMVGKLIVYAKSRDEAIRKMKVALCELVMNGVENNIELHTDILSADEFISGSYTTDFLPRILGS